MKRMNDKPLEQKKQTCLHSYFISLITHLQDLSQGIVRVPIYHTLRGFGFENVRENK